VVGDSGTVGRALDVLLALGDDEAANRGGLGVVRIAALLGREKSQVSRTLKTLAAHGFVDRDPDTLEYRLGWRLYTLAARTGRSRLLALAPAQLRRLVDELGETAHLSVLDGDEVLTLISERSPRLVQASDWSGHRVPAHCTSSGRALLLDADPGSLTGGLYRSVVRARELGYAAVDGEFEAGLVGVAAPVRDFRGRIVAALNVSGPKFRLGERLHAAGLEVRRAADDLSSRLGQSDDNGGQHG
jgi:IclR family transcriptional regulator, KDG regulon repressor